MLGSLQVGIRFQIAAWILIRIRYTDPDTAIENEQ